MRKIVAKDVLARLKTRKSISGEPRQKTADRGDTILRQRAAAEDDTDDLSRARKKLSAKLKPLGPMQDFLAERLAVLAVQYNHCLKAEIYLTLSDIEGSNENERFSRDFIRKADTVARLARYRHKIQQEFARVIEALMHLAANSVIAGIQRQAALEIRGSREPRKEPDGQPFTSREK